MRASLLTLLGGVSTALAAVKGYNYANQGQTYATFKSQFQTAASLTGATDFTSARLYTMIQEGTTNTPISAIQAAIDTKTTLLLGLWASVDQTAFNNELAALKTAISLYGSAFADLVVGISVGSEDLYRISPTGIAAGSGYGQQPSVLVNYIGQVRQAIQGTVLSSKLVGHVDTWNVFVNSTNSPVIAASDFLGLDEYPYYQTTDTNTIGNSSFLFFQAYDRVAAVAGGKPIWVTEAGWPTSGPTSNLAVASVANAEYFWQEVSCELQHRGIDTWWYILSDAGASPSFGVSNNGQPLYDLSCNATSGYVSSSSSVVSATATATGSASASKNATSVATTFATTLPAGYTMTQNGKTTVLSSASVVTSTGAAVATSAVSSATGNASVSTSRAATQTASGTATSTGAQFTGAAAKVEGSIAVMALGAVAAALAL